MVPMVMLVEVFHLAVNSQARQKSALQGRTNSWI